MNNIFFFNRKYVKRWTQLSIDNCFSLLIFDKLQNNIGIINVSICVQMWTKLLIYIIFQLFILMIFNYIWLFIFDKTAEKIWLEFYKWCLRVKPICVTIQNDFVKFYLVQSNYKYAKRGAKWNGCTVFYMYHVRYIVLPILSFYCIGNYTNKCRSLCEGTPVPNIS